MRMSGVITAGFLALLTGCGGGSFADEDPNGFQACTLLAQIESEQSAGGKMGTLLQIGEVARKAASEEIRDSVTAAFDEDAMAALEGTESEGFNAYFADRDDLKSACESEGFEF